MLNVKLNFEFMNTIHYQTKAQLYKDAKELYHLTKMLHYSYPGIFPEQIKTISWNIYQHIYNELKTEQEELANNDEITDYMFFMK